jgi:hypothetical protein
MSGQQTQAHDAETATEARHVAEDAIEAAEHGDMKEARFLAQEAAALNPDAAREVLDKADIPAGTKAGRKQAGSRAQ